MEALILVTIPIIVSGLTQMLKGISAIKVSTHKASILRLFAAAASTTGVVLLAIATDGVVPEASIQTFGEALAIFMSTQIPYWLGKSST